MASQLPAPLQSGLTERQVAFVENFVRLGGKNASGAAALAGYSTAGDGHRAIASRLLRKPEILALIRQIVSTEVQADAVASMDTLRQIRDDLGAAADVRRKAANDLLSQAGYLVEKFSTVRHVVEGDGKSFRGRNAELVIALREHAEAHGFTLTDEATYNERLRIAQIFDRRDMEEPEEPVDVAFTDVSDERPADDLSDLLGEAA